MAVSIRSALPSLSGRDRGSRRARLGRSLALCLVLLLGVGACGFDAQTMRPYTPADGANVDAGPGNTVKIRNLLILSRAKGQGFLSASIAADQDALVKVGGATIKPDGSEGTPLQATISAPIPLDNGELVVLTQRPLITITSPDLQAGLTAKVVLTFKRAGDVTVLVPVIDGNQEEYRTISPSPSAAPSS